MTKKEYIVPDISVVEMDHTVELLQSSGNVDPGEQGSNITGPIGLAPFEEPYNGQLKPIDV